MAKRKDEGAGFNPLGWMFTFSDLVTLLLTFFVMLLSMKQPEIEKLKSAFGIFASGQPDMITMNQAAGMENLQRFLANMRTPTSDELLADGQEVAREMDLPDANFGEIFTALQKDLNLRRDDRGWVITLANDLLFAPGQDTLSPQAEAVLKKAAQVLRFGDKPISVEGHTDGVQPGVNSRWRDNWGLSLNRAHAVMAFLRDQGKVPAGRLRVAALGDSRPVASNQTEAGRAKNRRTEIVILLDDNA